MLEGKLEVVRALLDRGVWPNFLLRRVSLDMLEKEETEEEDDDSPHTSTTVKKSVMEEEWTTLLDMALEQQQLSIARLLVERGANVTSSEPNRQLLRSLKNETRS